MVALWAGIDRNRTNQRLPSSFLIEDTRLAGQNSQRYFPLTTPFPDCPSTAFKIRSGVWDAAILGTIVAGA
jgi:hypothetical protein